jgi:hypothetical protein
MQQADSMNRRLSVGLFVAAGAVTVASLVGVIYAAWVVSTFPLPPPRIEALHRALLIGEVSFLFVPLALVVAGIRVRRRKRVVPAKHRSIARFGLLGLMVTTAVAAVAIRFPMATFLLTVVLPVVVMVVGGCLAALLYPIATAVHWLRRPRPGNSD